MCVCVCVCSVVADEVSCSNAPPLEAAQPENWFERARVLLGLPLADAEGARPAAAATRAAARHRDDDDEDDEDDEQKQDSSHTDDDEQ